MNPLAWCSLEGSEVHFSHFAMMRFSCHDGFYIHVQKLDTRHQMFSTTTMDHPLDPSAGAVSIPWCWSVGERSCWVSGPVGGHKFQLGQSDPELWVFTYSQEKMRSEPELPRVFQAHTSSPSRSGWLSHLTKDAFELSMCLSNLQGSTLPTCFLSRKW